ncbi:hypothetical protein BT96DRAFT_797939, partial [Gymnopus androsaceus JB14]
LWRQLKHPNILPLLGVNAELFNPSFCLISPWMANKDIISYLKQNFKHSRHEVVSTAFRSFEIGHRSGLFYLHSRDPPVVHGDIRRGGYSLFHLVTCKILTLHRKLHRLRSSCCSHLVTAETTWSIATNKCSEGAIRWMAPELIIQDLPADSSSSKTSRDVYAFGCTIVEILSMQPPFHDLRTDVAVIHGLIAGKRPSRPKDVWCP